MWVDSIHTSPTALTVHRSYILEFDMFVFTPDSLPSREGVAKADKERE